MPRDEGGRLLFNPVRQSSPVTPLPNEKAPLARCAAGLWNYKCPLQLRAITRLERLPAQTYKLNPS